MRKVKIFIKSLFVVFCYFGFLLGFGLSAESNFCINATNSVGQWQKGVVTQRTVAFTDKANIKSAITISISSKGKYQLLAYVHHNWRISCPCIYVEAIDSVGKVHRGYHKIENIWYLGPEDQGRWFFVSLSDNPYWDLPEGILKLNFWAEAKDSAWGNLSIPMEGNVSIEQFFLIPVTGTNSEIFLPWMVNIKSGTGNWQICEYDHEHGTNLIKTSEKNSLFRVDSAIPVSASYICWLSFFSVSGGRLELEIKNGSLIEKNIIKLKAAKEWSSIYIGPIILDKGKCSIYFKNLDQNEVMIDRFILIPDAQVGNNSLLKS